MMEQAATTPEAFSEATDGYDERDYQIAELVDLVEHLSTFLHPGTSAWEPGDEEALDRAEAAIEHYKPGNVTNAGAADTDPIQRGRELAALDIEAEARAYEEQFGLRSGAAPGAMLQAAKIAREGRE